MASPVNLYGTWRLVSWTVEVMQTGEQLRQFGDDPPGFIHFTPEGRMFAVLTASGRKPVETEADQIAAFGSLIAYTGRYRVEGNKGPASPKKTLHNGRERLLTSRANA